MSEEVYSVSFCSASSHLGLSVGGERGLVQHISLDQAGDLKLNTIKTLHDLGSPVNTLQWSSDGRYLVIAGSTNQVFVYDSETKSTSECKGVEISSEGLYACISPDDKTFAVSFKDGTVVIGDLETKSLSHKVQIGEIVKGGNNINQASFDKNGNLYVPGKKHIQRCEKAQGYKITHIEDIAFSSSIGGILLPTHQSSDLIVVAVGS